MNLAPFAETWVYLSTTPLLGLTITLLAYQAAYYVFSRFGYHALFNPVPIAILLIVSFLKLSGISYQQYFEGAQFVHFLLGPATVALAIPLFTYWDRLKKMTIPLLIALLAGSATAAISAMAIAKWLGASEETILSLAPKSVTTPIAMGVAEKIGGLPSLTAVMVIITGVTGALCFQGFFRMLKVKDHAIQGFAVGLTSHGLGTARAFLVSEEMGAFSALAMGLNGILTAFLLPAILS